ncbi:MAG: calcium/sodium antiporter [Firmicutes bacterium]|nr:calcium/sodium antiporter [Bacillota bacterium]
MDALSRILFIAGIALLLLGGDVFVKGAAGVACHFKLPEILVGATVVSIGTTLPEVVVSCQAAFKGSAGIAYGNAIGSVICNTALIAALVIVLKPAKANKKTLLLPTAFFFASALIYSAVAWTIGRFDRWAGILLLVIFAVYMLSTVDYIKKHRKRTGKKEAEEVRENIGKIPEEPWKMAVFIVAGIIAIAYGSKFIVDNGTLIAKALGVPDSVIGLTMVALGTSLPELITALQSHKIGSNKLAIGNIIGANLLNIVLVSGMAITISPFDVPEGRLIGGVYSSLIVEIPLMLAVMAVLCVPALIKGRFSRWQGILLLCIFVAFNIFQYLS